MEMEDTSVKTKLTFIRSRLLELQKRQREHYRQSLRLGQLFKYSKVLIHTLNAVATTSILINMIGKDQSLIACAITNGLSLICSAVFDVLDLNNRHLNHYNSHMHLLELYNNIEAHIMNEQMTSETLNLIIEDLNHRIVLLDRNAPLIRMSTIYTRIPMIIPTE